MKSTNCLPLGVAIAAFTIPGIAACQDVPVEEEGDTGGVSVQSIDGTGVSLESIDGTGRQRMNTAEEQGLVATARADLAERFTIPKDEIHLTAVDTVVWASAALGCPEEGKAYAMVTVPGLRIRLRYGESIYQYHAQQGEAPFFCPVKRIRDPWTVEDGSR